MAYQKRRSATVEKARTRLRGLESGQPKMDLGNGLTLQSYATLIELSDMKLESYNLALAEVDRLRIEFAEVEASIAALSSRILSAVAAVYGKDSKEYEMAGGKRPSTYKRSKKQSMTSVNDSQFSNGTSSTSSPNGTGMNGATAAAQA